MRVLYFGTYDSHYSRNRVLMRGLREQDVEVIECNSRARWGLKYLVLIWKYLWVRKDFNAVLVAFPGQEVMLLARLLTRKPILFDVFTSHYGGHILDRGTYGKESLLAGYYRFLDTFSCRLADLVLLDTHAHIDFFVREFNLSREKFRRVFVGTDSAVFFPRPAPEKSGDFLVHFHGNYIPLQGVPIILEAAKELEDEGIVFNLIGRGQLFQQVRDRATERKVGNVRFLSRVPYHELAERMARADVCLGIFGDTQKASLVIPNKAFEALAMGKPLITADTAAIKELLQDGENVILCERGDAHDLAMKIRLLRGDLGLRERVAIGGRALFESMLTERHLGAQVKEILHETVLLRR